MKKLLIIFVTLVIFISGCGSVQQKVESETSATQSSVQTEIYSWSQFHGSALHTGYVSVKGPEKATLKWKFQLGKMSGGDPNSVVVSSDGIVYVAGSQNIFALDKDGKEIWSKNYQGTQGPTVAEDGTVYVLAQNTIVALDKDGNEKWKFKTGGNTGFGPTIGSDGTIYQGSWDGYFYAINKDGTLKWKYKTDGAISYPASIDQNGIIYLGGGDAHSGPDSNLYAFDSGGNLKWKYDTKALRVGSPAIGSDGLVYVAAAPYLIVLDSSGNLKWKKGPEGNFNNPQANNNSQVFKVGECGGPPLPPCGGIGQCGAPPLPACGGIQPFGIQPPTQNGNFPSKDDIAGIITPAIASDGTIYIGNAQGILSAVDPDTQEVKWTYQTDVDLNKPGFYGLPSFPVVDKDGTVYIGSVDGNMYAIDKNGELLWKYQTDGQISESSPAFGPDGTLYFTSKDGYVYAIGG